MNLMNLTDAPVAQLLQNGRQQQEVAGTAQEKDFFPVVRLFLPGTDAVWLLTELEPRHGIAFGLCDLGFGMPELGSVSLMELMTLRSPDNRFGVEVDTTFVADRPLRAYAREARACGRIVTDLPTLTDDSKDGVANPGALSPYLEGEGVDATDWREMA